VREEIEKLQIPSSRQKHEGAKRHNSRVFVRWLSWWLCGRFSAAKNNENPKPEDIPMKIPIARISIWMFYGPKPNPPSSSLFHASYVRRLRAQPHQHPPTAQHQPTSMPPAQLTAPSALSTQNTNIQRSTNSSSKSSLSVAIAAMAAVTSPTPPLPSAAAAAAARASAADTSMNGDSGGDADTTAAEE
jgi:hypothetical protein